MITSLFPLVWYTRTTQSQRIFRITVSSPGLETCTLEGAPSIDGYTWRGHWVWAGYLAPFSQACYGIGRSGKGGRYPARYHTAKFYEYLPSTALCGPEWNWI